MLKKMGIKIIEGDLIEIKDNYIRHHAESLSNMINDLALGHSDDE